MKLRPVPVELNKKILVGTIGYQLLGNHSIGPILLPILQKMDWPSRVVVDELNWGPIAIIQQFEAMDEPYDRVVLLGAVERPGRAIGTMTLFRWKGGLPDLRQVQACVGDAATGVISIDNLLVIGEYFKAWPEEVFLIDVEPGPEKAGEHLSAEVEQIIPTLCDFIKTIAIEGQGENEILYLKGEILFKD